MKFLAVLLCAIFASAYSFAPRVASRMSTRALVSIIKIDHHHFCLFMFENNNNNNFITLIIKQIFYLHVYIYKENIYILNHIYSHIYSFIHSLGHEERIQPFESSHPRRQSLSSCSRRCFRCRGYRSCK